MLTIGVTFIVVDALTLYNVILGCSTLNPNRIYHCIYHQLIEFTTHNENGKVRGNQLIARSCYVHFLRRHVLNKKEKETLSIQMDEDPREVKSRPTPVKGLKMVQLDGPDRVIHIGTMLLGDQDEAMMLFFLEPQ